MQKSLYGGPPAVKQLTNLEDGIFMTEHQLFESQKVMAIRELQ